MKTLQIRFMLIALCATVVVGAIAGCQSILGRNANSLPARNHEEITLVIADKQDPGYSSGFRLGAQRNVGMTTLSSRRQFKFVCEFVRMDALDDVYALDLSLPAGSNIVKTIRFNGKNQLVYETSMERIEITQPANH